MIVNGHLAPVVGTLLPHISPRTITGTLLPSGHLSPTDRFEDPITGTLLP
nr:hypothetical protein Iba_chr05cCG13040 [Ipomoea batatas]